MPGTIKNLIDWASCFCPQPFDGKHGLLLSASPSLAGGNRGLWSLRMPLEHLGARVFPDMFSLAMAHKAFAGDAIADSTLQARFEKNVQAFLSLAEAAKRFGTPKHPRDLESNHRVVNYVSARTGRVNPMRFSEKQRPIDITAGHVVGVNESNAHFAAGVAGLGVIQTFAFLARTALDRGDVVPLLARFQPPPYTFHLAYSPNRYVSNRLRVFIEWTAAVFAALT